MAGSGNAFRGIGIMFVLALVAVAAVALQTVITGKHAQEELKQEKANAVTTAEPDSDSGEEKSASSSDSEKDNKKMTDSNRKLPETGQEAPTFQAPVTGWESDTFDLASLRGDKQVVLYFYPKDGTPGCTEEACSFRDSYSEFRDAGALVVGVSRDDLESHREFREEHNLPFPLVYDKTGEITETYGVWGEMTIKGKTIEAIHRTTFLIGKDGKIKHVWPDVSPSEHASEVLAAIHGEGSEKQASG